MNAASRLRIVSALVCLVILAGWTHGSALTNVVQTLKIGAGGWIRGEDIECDQGVGQCAGTGTTTKVIRTDTYGAYVYNASAPNPGNAGGTGVWQQVILQSSFPSGDPAAALEFCFPSNPGCGVYEFRVAPSNTNIAFLIIQGYLYKTTNLVSGQSNSGWGGSWAPTGFTQDTNLNANSSTAQYGPRIAIDPFNSSNVIVCGITYCDKSVDGGATFSAITGITNASTVGMFPVFDPHTQNVVYIGSTGAGVYRTTGGIAGSFTLTLSGPTTFIELKVGPDGTLYVVDSVPDNVLHIFTGGAWTTSTLPAGQSISWIDVDPAHSNFASNAFIVAIQGAGETSYTTTSGGSWSAWSSFPPITANDIPWLAGACNVSGRTFCSVGQIQYDPAQSNVAIQTTGVGVMTISPSTTSSPAWVSLSAGIEQLDSTWGISVPGGNFAAIFQDRPVFQITNTSVYPSTYGTSPGSSFLVNGWSADYASSSPTSQLDTLANEGTADLSGGYASGAYTLFSNTAYVSTNSTPGGGIASLTPNDIAVLPVDNSPNSNTPWVTTNGGASWSPVSCSGVPTTPATGWGSSPFDYPENIAADRVNSYYLAVNFGAAAGVYKITLTGTCTKVFTGTIDGHMSFQQKLRSVPGNADTYLYTSGQQTCPCPVGESFFISKNGFATSPTAISNVQDVWAFGYGKAVTGTDPAVYIYGWVGGVGGIWRGDNVITGTASWAQLTGLFPNNSADEVKVIEGDLNTAGRVYIGFGGSGFAHIN